MVTNLFRWQPSKRSLRLCANVRCSLISVAPAAVIADGTRSDFCSLGSRLSSLDATAPTTYHRRGSNLLHDVVNSRDLGERGSEAS